MAEAKAKAEEDLSMEEILQQIRTIIAEDGEEVGSPMNGANTTKASDVLELTEVIEEVPAAPQVAAPANSANDILSKIDQVVMPEPATPRPAAPVPSAPMASAPPSAPASMQNSQAYIDSLLSTEAASAAAAAFKKVQPLETPIMTTPSPQFRSGTSVEDLVMEALKPMIKQWLDANLPNIVERIVEREVRKLKG